MVLNLKPIRISLFARRVVAVVVGYGDGAVECWLPVCRLDGLPGCQAAELPAPATLAATAMATTVTQTATGGRSQLNNASHNNSNSNNNSHNDSAPPIPIPNPPPTPFPVPKKCPRPSLESHWQGALPAAAAAARYCGAKDKYVLIN